MDKVTITSPGIQEPLSAPLPETRPNNVETNTLATWPNQLLQSRSQGWGLGLPYYVDATGTQPPVMIAVGGGKGGVGKSLVSANLSSRLAMSGKRVLAIDLDVGGANLHTYFGLNAPKYNLADAFVYGRKTLGEAVVQTSIQGVEFLGGGREEAWGGMSKINSDTLEKLMASVLRVKEERGIDIVVFDLGAGTNPITLDVFSIANLGMITVLPEPTSIENAYLFLKTSLFNIIDHVGERTGAVEAAEAVKASLIANNGASRHSGYSDKLKHVASSYPQFVAQIRLALAGRTVGFAINQIRSQKDIDIGKSMEVIGNRYFGYETNFCGFLNYDDAAWKSLRNRRMLLSDFPHAVLSRRFNDLVRNVLNNLGF